MDAIPVLIAGGGPVGLALAALLARQGVRSMVLEADAGYCTGSRAICISRRSQEILAWAGAAARAIAGIGLHHEAGHAMPRQQRGQREACLLYTSPSPRDGLLSRMPSSA